MPGCRHAAARLVAEDLAQLRMGWVASAYWIGTSLIVSW
jgi:hypothetical protein